MEAELAAHLEAETRELRARGLDAAEARRRALATMGHVDLIKEECRDSRGTAFWEHLKHDVAFGLRMLFKNRTFSSMALATGSSSAMAPNMTELWFRLGIFKSRTSHPWFRRACWNSSAMPASVGRSFSALVQERPGGLCGAPRRTGFQYARPGLARARQRQPGCREFLSRPRCPARFWARFRRWQRPSRSASDGNPQPRVLDATVWRAARRVGPPIGARRRGVRDRWRNAGGLRVPVAGCPLLDSDAPGSAQRR